MVGCGRSGLRCLQEANARLHGRDTECNIIGSVRRLIVGRCLVTRKKTEPVL